MTAPSDLLHHPLVMSLAWALLHLVWQGALVGLLLAGMLLALRRASANARYLAACIALIALAACPCVTFVLLINCAGRGDVALARGILFYSHAFYSHAFHSHAFHLHALTSGRAIPSLLPTAAAWPYRIAIGAERFLPALSGLWCIGVAVMSLRLLGGWARVHRLKCREAQPIRGHLQERCATIARRMGIRHPVALLESALIEAPSTFGWLRAVVLLPVGMLSGLSPGAIEALLAHELAHVRRHDFLVNLLQTALETLLFYHPATWWISRQIRLEREYCCDDLAVAMLGDRNGYAKALAALETWRQSVPAPALSATGGELLPRIRRVLGAPARQVGLFPTELLPVVRAALTVTALCLLSAVTLALTFRRGATALTSNRSVRRFPVTTHTLITHTALLETEKPGSQRSRANRQITKRQLTSLRSLTGAAAPDMPFVLPLITPDLVSLRRDLQANELPDNASINGVPRKNGPLHSDDDIDTPANDWPANDWQTTPVEQISPPTEVAAVSASSVALWQMGIAGNLPDAGIAPATANAGEEVNEDVSVAAEQVARGNNDIERGEELAETQAQHAEEQAERDRERGEELAERGRERAEERAESIQNQAELAKEKAERAIEQAQRAVAQVERAIEQARRTREQETHVQEEAARAEQQGSESAK